MFLVQKLQALASESIQLWVAFGTGIHLRYLAAHEIANTFTNNVALALPAFHAFTGCDTVSYFYAKSKKTALDTWKSFPEVTPVFIALSRAQTEIAEEWMSTLERFVVLLYDRTSSSSSVNEARKQLLTRKARNFGARFITRTCPYCIPGWSHLGAWGQALVPNPPVPIPSPQYWGGISDNTVRNHKVIPIAAVINNGFRGGCGFQKVSLRCTAMCQCAEECESR